MADNLLDGLMQKVVLVAVDKVLEDENSQKFFKDIGIQIGDSIPGTFAEPKINKVVDLIQEGMRESTK